MRAPAWIEAGQGDTALLCLHGVSSSAEVWRPLLPVLAAQGHRVLAWDMPGYGNSQPLALLDFPLLADALAQLLDAAGLARAVIVGHSLGGMIAMEFAARHPQRVTALVLACTTASSGVGQGAARAAFLAQRLGVLEQGGSMAALAGRVLPAMLGPQPPAGLLGRMRRLMAAIPPAAYRAAVEALPDFDRRAALPAFDFPVLCIAGEQDRIATPPTMRRIAERIEGARFEVMGKVGHLAPFEDEPSFAALIGEFPGARA